VGTLLAADPFGGVALVIVTVEREAVTVRTKWDAMLIITTRETGEGQIIAILVAQADGTDRFEFRVNELEDFIHALPGIAEELADLKIREASAQGSKPGDGEQVIIDIGRDTGRSHRPEQEEPVIDDVEGFGLVTVMMFAAWGSRPLCLCSACAGLVRTASRLVGASVENVGSLGVTGRCIAAVFAAGLGVAGATFFALGVGRARSRQAWL
jgi:hypothetical protein